MNSTDPDPTPRPCGAGREAQDRDPPDVGPSRLGVWVASLTAAVAVSLIAWTITESTKGAFQPRKELVEVMGMTTMRPTGTTRAAADFKNRLLSLALFGGIFTLMMGLSGGLAGHSPVRGLVTGMAAHAVGTLVVAISSWALLRVIYRGHLPDLDDLLTPILVHGGIWSAAGIVGGAAFAVGLGRPRSIPGAIAGACLGAFAASAMVHLLGEAYFNDMRPTDPSASTPVFRFVTVALVSLLMAAGVAFECSRSRPRPRS